MHRIEFDAQLVHFKNERDRERGGRGGGMCLYVSERKRERESERELERELEIEIDREIERERERQR
jgi:hypothetical protein